MSTSSGVAVPVSIGMPVYNGENYLQAALDSILGQTFTDFELIVSDNASSDATPDIVSDAARHDRRVRLIRHKVNAGAAPNYNLLVDEAKGRWFKWASHDDVIAPTFLEATLSAFDAVPSASLVYSSAEFIDAAGRVTGPLDDRVATEARHPAARVFHVVQNLNLMASVFGVFDRAMLAGSDRIGSYIASDYTLVVEMALHGPIVKVGNEPLFQRRVHKKMSRQANTSDRQVLDWFSPGASQRLSTRNRLFVEYLKAAGRADSLPIADRVASAAAVLVGVPYRRTRVRLGALRHR